MVEAIKKIVLRLFPELKGNYHLPRFARVVGISDAPKEGAQCDEFRPHYAVDIEFLTAQGVADSTLPIYKSVPLPLPIAGTESGFFGFPEEGATVVVHFAYGLPTKPYISQVLPHKMSLPAFENGDQVWSHSEEVQQRCDKNGNWQRKTHSNIEDVALKIKQLSKKLTQVHDKSDRTIKEHCNELIHGIKRIRALGALRLLSGGSANLSALDNLNLTTGSDLNEVVSRDKKTTIGENQTEDISGDKTTTVGGTSELIATTIKIGNGTEDVLDILDSLIGIVGDIATALAIHNHSSLGAAPPSNAGDYTAAKASADQLSTDLGGMM